MVNNKSGKKTSPSSSQQQIIDSRESSPTLSLGANNPRYNNKLTIFSGFDLDPDHVFGDQCTCVCVCYRDYGY
ncbi:hypothetical protein KQX54_005195 [Cotesia glomerata]|uniref:Uncharacterized protein n=1 Tax=Cotesia glomerata TaxID=32391 RepID=A0AAV7I8D9_COTGL|nr:hypothetical protein KQX54_005195 [Cotesia glomerata]